MKIVSKHNDYYDSIAYMYGGGDPKIYYERDKYNTNVVTLPSGRRDPFRNIPWYSTNNFEFKHLIVGDKMFVVYRDATNYFNEFKILTDPAPLLKRSSKWNHNAIKKFVETCQFRQFPEDLLFVTRQIGNPIYLIKTIAWHTGKNHVYVEDSYTPLYKYGLPQIYSAEQIYQDLSYFLANKMKDSPDLQPAGKPPQTDKEKLLAHGMDARWSFRHRK